MTLNQQEQNQLISAINKDPALSSSDKQSLIEKIREGTWFSDATVGAAAGLAISKFLKLSTKSQILMTTAGFGIGKYLLDKSPKHDKFVEYNDKVRAYDIKT
jgi:hypothetical protein